MRTRLLMVTPENREIHRFRKGQLNNFIQLTMPYLAGFVDPSQYAMTLVDEYHQRVPYGRSFDLVAITVNTPNAPHCYAMAQRFRAEGAAVVFGGPHATLRPEDAVAHCDHLVIGEAEETWPQLLADFRRGTAKPIYRCDRTPSLAGLPHPRRDLLRGRPFTQGAVFATRGCPYACRYCNLKQIYCPPFRARPVEEVVEDIRGIHSRYFVFWDDNFFGDPAYALELMRALAPLKKRWAAQVTMDHCRDEALLNAARAAGCLYLFMGLESFSAASLATVNKGVNRVEAYREVIERVHRHGIAVQAGIIFGFDTDTPSVFADTLAACEALGIDGATVSMLTPLPGTPLYDEMRNAGRLLTDDWSAYSGKTRVTFAPAGMTAEELLAGYQWFRREFYSLRSIWRRLRACGTNLPYRLLMNLGYAWARTVGTAQMSRPVEGFSVPASHEFGL